MLQEYYPILNTIKSYLCVPKSEPINLKIICKCFSINTNTVDGLTTLSYNIEKCSHTKSKNTNYTNNTLKHYINKAFACINSNNLDNFYKKSLVFESN